MIHNIPVAIILPFYNGEKLIEKASNKIIRILKRLIESDTIMESSYLMLIDESSKDNSWYEAGKVVARNPRIARAIKLSRVVKSNVILKKSEHYLNIVVNFDNYEKVEEYILKTKHSLIADNMHFLKDIFKSSLYEIIDEYE